MFDIILLVFYIIFIVFVYMFVSVMTKKIKHSIQINNDFNKYINEWKKYRIEYFNNKDDDNITKYIYNGHHID
mgnify:FL=1